jgi:hypothetical protein
MRTPRVESATAPQVYNLDGGFRQLLLENRDTTNGITVKLNSSTNGYTLDPGTRLSLRNNGGLYKVDIAAVAGSPTFQIMLL